MSNNKSFGISLEVKDFIRQLLTDPTSAAQVLEACKEGPADKSTSPLGASNLGTMEKQEWFTVFMANSKDVPAGQAGHIIRPRSEKTQGRIILNLRAQDKEQKAVQTIGEKLGTPGDALQAAKDAAQSGVLTDEQRAALIANLQAGANKGRQDTPEVPAEAQAALEG